ncbi:isochorismatase family protein [Marinobacter sp.]|uniref:isochorismatase family protein n=1 Tax=Marinobacter sp. TaxID=50741 RepID=UPI00384ABE28
MHQVSIRQEIIDRVMARRQRFHLFDRLDPTKTAVIAIDMQNTFLQPGSPAEVPLSRQIVEPINRLNEGVRGLGGHIVWVTHANSGSGEDSDWPCFFNNFVADDVRARTIDSLLPGRHGQEIWPELHVEATDIQITKNRYSALIPGASDLDQVLRGLDVTNLLITGTKTNVCCESTARDAMMMNFNVVMVSDATAALSDNEHQATLETVIQQFGDVLTVSEVLEIIK